jgi:putative transposase
MSRIARIVVPGYPHHVTQRGNRQSVIFHSDKDRQKYLFFLSQYSAQYGLEIWAYCLMDNHVHLIVVPREAESLSLALRTAHTMYANYFNEQSSLSGHLWQGRFYSSALDEKHLWAAIRYVEQNPVRARMVAHAKDYPWSSAAAHCSLKNDPVLTPGFPPTGVVEDWEEWLRLYDGHETLEFIRSRNKTGRPCGGEEFLDMIEKTLGVSVKLKKSGRPLKDKA